MQRKAPLMEVSDTEVQRLRNRRAAMLGRSIADLGLYQPTQLVDGEACHLLRVAAANERRIAPKALAAAQAYSDACAGIGLAVWREGAMEHEAYRPGAGPHTRTESFSLNKTVTALMVGAAIADGLIASVDEPVGRYLEDWRGDRRGDITLRELLSMSSGLQPFSIVDGDIEALRLLVGEQVEAAALASRLRSSPGTVFEYDNANFQVAGAVLRAALAGRESYAHYLARRLWRPLGNGPAFLWAEAQGSAPRFSCGLQATLRDWLQVGRLILDRGFMQRRPLVPAAWISQMTTPSPANPQYGLGLWLGQTHEPRRTYASVSSLVALHGEPFLPPDVIYLDGFGGQRVYVVASLQLVIARTGEVRADFDDAVLVNTLRRGLDV